MSLELSSTRQKTYEKTLNPQAPFLALAISSSDLLLDAAESSMRQPGDGCGVRIVVWVLGRVAFSGGELSIFGDLGV